MVRLLVSLLDLYATLFLSTFHNFDFFLAQPIQLVHQPVDLGVRRLDLALEHLFVLRQPGVGCLPMQGEHALDQRHHARMSGGVGRIIESVKAGAGVEELVC